MPSTSLLMYNDCRDTLDKALDAGDHGLEVNCETYAKAVVFRSRCNHFRSLDRKANTTVYPKEHPLWGRSVYDHLVLSIPKVPPFNHLVIIRPRRDLEPYKTGPIGTWTGGESNV